MLPDRPPFKLTRANYMETAVGLSALNRNALKLMEMTERHPVFLTFADSWFVLDHQQSFEQLVHKLSNLLWDFA